MSANAIPNEQVLGTILHAATSPEYALQAVVFTDRRVLGVSLAALGRGARAAGLAGDLGAVLLGGTPGGVSGLLGMRAWGKYKASVTGQPALRTDPQLMTPEVLAAAGPAIPYETVKAVAVKKVWGSSDTLLDVAAGFLGSGKWVTTLSPDEVRAFVARTPLGPKLRA